MAMPARKALLVGVDRYERPEIPSLRGCVNDVLMVRTILKTYFGLANDHIRVVVNERATKRNILHRLRRLVDDAGPGDVLIFYFAGHGSQVRDRNGDELTDQLDEIICPYDMDWDEKTFILDDDFDTVFADIPEHVLLEFFLDCCHSGASPGAILPPPELRADVRFLRPPIDIAARFEGEEETLPVHHFPGCSCFKGNVLWAAAGESQTSAEDYFQGQAHGAFTYLGCRFIEENFRRIAGRDYSRQRLLEDVRAYLASYGYTQVPELSAPDPLRAVEPLRPIIGHVWESVGTEHQPESTEKVGEAAAEAWTPFGMGRSGS